MYAAKKAGRGRYEVFRGEMAREFGETLGLEYELRLGLQRGEFTVHYQPEIEVVGGAIVGRRGAAALDTLRRAAPSRRRSSSRWPRRRASSSRSASSSLREACGQTARWERDGLLPERFVTWVNLSGSSSRPAASTSSSAATLAETGVPPRRLGLEVTETAIVQGGAAGERARGELQALHRDGVSIAIDDFGTGFSSLGQLRRFPIDMIKVDRSFIQGAEHDPRDAAITANVVSLAHALGLVAMAEGVETEAQLASCAKLGCDLAQGFLFARAMPPAELAELLGGAAWGLRHAA